MTNDKNHIGIRPSNTAFNKNKWLGVVKHLCVIVVLYFSVSAVQALEVNKISSDVPAEHARLIKHSLKQLGIPQADCYCSLAVAKQLPFGEKDTVVVIPEIAPKDVEGEFDNESTFALNRHILVVDTDTGRIKSRYFESAEKSEWKIHITELTKIVIDTARYNINDKDRAFGVRAKYVVNSQAAPRYFEKLSLYVPEQKRLVPVLKDIGISSSVSFLDEYCYSGHEQFESVLSMGSDKTNGYRDILLTTKSVIENARNDDCSNLVAKEAKNTETLHFVDGEYQLQPEGLIYLYEGKLNNNIPVEVEFQILPFAYNQYDPKNHKDAKLAVGHITYLNTKAKKPIELIGYAFYDNNRLSGLSLDEYLPSGEITGYMWLSTFGSGYVGKWHSPDGKYPDADNMSLTLKDTTPALKATRPPQKEWFGDYNYEYGEEGRQGEFSLKRKSDGRAYFSLFSVTHAPGRNIADTADYVTLDDTGFTLKIAPKCELNVAFYGGFAVADYTSMDTVSWDCRFGHNATAEGVFKKVK